MIPSANTERPVVFPCEGECLFGILHPSRGAVGVVIVVGGPQYRAGSHRQFVQVARELAAAGHPVLRFDVRGMGDSSGPLRSFEGITPDIGAAIDALVMWQHQLRTVVLWGLCDGASAALLYVHERRDSRVGGLCLANPWVRSTQTLAQARLRHYYLGRMLERSFWIKLLQGKVKLEVGADVARQVAAARQCSNDTFQGRMLAGLQSFEGAVCVLLSADDLTAQEFSMLTQRQQSWQRALSRPGVQRLPVPMADHTFSRPDAKARVHAMTIGWLRAAFGDSKADGSSMSDPLEVVS